MSVFVASPVESSFLNVESENHYKGKRSLSTLIGKHVHKCLYSIEITFFPSVLGKK